MIQKFVNKFMEYKPTLRETFKAKIPENYIDIVREVVRAINPQDKHSEPSVENIQQVDFGDYQGTLCFVIGAKGYQPSYHWGVCVDYGSCSGCDTLQAIQDERSWSERENPATDSQLEQLMTLALHVVQRLKPIHVSYEEERELS